MSGPPNYTVPAPSELQIDSEYGSSSVPLESSPLAQSLLAPGPSAVAAPFTSSTAPAGGRFIEDWEASQRGSSIMDGNSMRRSDSVLSNGEPLMPSRGGTLKKKGSVKRASSLKRSSSRRSSRAGSMRSLALQSSRDVDEMQSAFFSPVPTSGNPTEILATRFQSWRKVLKDLIAYFKELQNHYEQRSKSLVKVTNIINNTTAPPNFLQSGGLDDALQLLKAHHAKSTADFTKAKSIQDDVVLQLTGLRSDLNQKIKEIKNLSGDFKNSVDKEMDGTRKAVNALQEALGHSDVDPTQSSGKLDPYLLRLAVDRQLERQIDEENYLHQAYLNLEASGRELEAIVVGEIQKSYNAFAGIMKREADDIFSTVEEMRTGPIAMPKDHEWDAFVRDDESFVDPRMPVRQAQYIRYPGRDNELSQEVRAGLLERKSKYLKSYTPGWFVLTPTHIHEFKSADKTQAPIMSLYLPDQKLGSHSQAGGGSKFMLKGRQTGSLHSRHSWIFRAESHETMMAWYEDIKTLTESSPQERNAYVRQHARSISGTSQRASSVASSDGINEEDEEPFSATASATVAAISTPKSDGPRRPNAGGRFPSDLNISTQRGLQAPFSPSSGDSSSGNLASDAQERDAMIIAGASGLPGSGVGEHYGVDAHMSPSHATMVSEQAEALGINPYTSQPIEQSPQGHFTSMENPAIYRVAAVALSDDLPASSALAQHPTERPDTATTDVSALTNNTSVSGLISDAGSGSVPTTAATSAAAATTFAAATAGMEPVDPDRPRVSGVTKHQSVQSASQLHVPGEYPKRPVTPPEMSQ